MMLFPITEGSERTYVHPYSYYDAGTPFDRNCRNKVKFITTGEFAPHQELAETDFLYELQKGCYGNRWQQFLYKLRYTWDHVVRRSWALLQYLQKHKLPLKFAYRMWTLQFPVYCASIYHGPRISVPGTLSANSKWTETYYLIPSQEWIKKKLANWLVESSKNGHNDLSQLSPGDANSYTEYHDKVRNSYLTWVEEQVKLGRKIAFLTSLDT